MKLKIGDRVKDPEGAVGTIRNGFEGTAFVAYDLSSGKWWNYDDLIILNPPNPAKTSQQDPPLNGAITPPVKANPGQSFGFGVFVGQVAARLEKGERDYGDQSFERSEKELLTELQQEALDLAGWGFVLWQKIERAKAKIK